MKKVYTSQAPTPAGHYSQAMIHNGLVYVSGQLPINPATGEKELGSIEKQTRQVLENLKVILNSAGSGLASVIKTTVYISDILLWDEVNEVYAEYFGKVRPARSVVPVKELHFGFQIEMEAIAAVEE
jgi:2-iminobutanoate/2-iminopropanoate deaminase